MSSQNTYHEINDQVAVGNTWFDVTVEVSRDETLLSQVFVRGAARHDRIGWVMDPATAYELFVKDGDKFVCLATHLIAKVAPPQLESVGA